MDLFTTTDRNLLSRATTARRGSREMKKQLAKLLSDFPAETYDIKLAINFDETDHSVQFIAVPVSKATGLEEDSDLVAMLDQFPTLREELRESGELRVALESIYALYQRRIEQISEAILGHSSEITVVCN